MYIVHVHAHEHTRLYAHMHTQWKFIDEFSSWVRSMEARTAHNRRTMLGFAVNLNDWFCSSFIRFRPDNRID